VEQRKRITLVLHHERDSLWIGEPFRPKLQVVNERDAAVEVGRGFVLSAEEFAFAPPDAVHLLSPVGTDLAAPYAGEPSRPEPIRVGPRESAWTYLQVHAHLPLDRPGRYTFWLELADGGGVLHVSNRVPVNFHEVPSNVPAGQVVLELSVPASVRAAELTRTKAQATFRNRSDRELVFLKPQEDSAYGWVNPVYRFTVVDAAGRALALAGRSGTMALPAYTESARFRVAPGRSHALELPLPDVPRMRAAGTYRVRLTYLVRDRAIGKGGVVLDRLMEWDPEVFVGRLESNEVEVSVHE
jgi:hypothetical protein